MAAGTAGADDFSETARETSPWSFGFGGGVNLSRLHFSELDEDVFPDNNSNTSGIFSVYVERVFGNQRSFGIRPQLSFLTRGGHLNNIYSKTGLDLESSLVGQRETSHDDFYEAAGIDNVSYGLKATYVDFRIPLTYHIGKADWRVRPYVYIAPIFGFAHRGYIDARVAMEDGSYSGVKYDLTKANMSSFLFAGAVGAGARYQFAVNGALCTLGIDLNYQYGFTDTYGEEKDGKIKNAVKLVADAGNAPEGTRKFSGFEIAATVGIPFNVFSAKEKTPCETIYLPAPEPVVEEPAPIVEEKPCYSLEEIMSLMAKGDDVRGKTICSIDDINFDFGKSDIKPASYEYLDKLAETIKRTGAHIVVKGHTDNVGNAETNMELSRQRALSVVNYLAKRGVSRSILSHEAYGMTKPLTSNDTEEGRRLNRRVEFEIR